MNQVLATLILQLSPLVIQLVLTLIKELSSMSWGSDLDNRLDVIRLIVEGIDRDHPDWPGPEKQRWARDAIKIGQPQLTDNQINALIELFVLGSKNVV